jgi:hypothetical protein
MFVDAQGRRWEIEIDIPACRRVRNLAGVNLLTLDLPALMDRLADPITLCEVLWAIVQPEAAAAGVREDEFLRACAVNLSEITDQLLTGPGGLSDFFRRLGQTAKATALTTIWTRLQTLALAAPERMPSLIDRTLDWMTAQILSGTSGTAATMPPAGLPSIHSSQA